MKNLLLLFLLAFICPIYGQNTDEIIQQIRTEYDLIQNEFLPKSKKVVVGRNFIKSSKLFLIEDEFADLKFDCVAEVCNRVFELYFYRDSTSGKWQLVKITSQSSFGDGFDIMRTEAAYYFRNQQLIFHYLVELNDYNGEEAGEEENLHSRSEHRYYYDDGQIIKYLYKNKELLLTGYNPEHLGYRLS